MNKLLSLIALIMICFCVSAQQAEPPVIGNCAGGSCTSYRLNGTPKCTACCPAGKTPLCQDIGGCTCKLEG